MTTRFFLYYVPGLRNDSGFAEKACQVVGSSIEGGKIVARNVDAGPGQGGPGVLFAALPAGVTPEPGEVEKALATPGYCADPSRQTWIAGAGFWVGYDHDRKPGPEDLARASQRAGYFHDSEGYRWLVPVARRLDGSSGFDERIVYEPSGDLQQMPLDRYSGLCLFASEHFEALTRLFAASGVDEAYIEYDRRFADVTCEALGVNYHVGRYELSLLGALTKENTAHMASLLCDAPMLVEVAKASVEKKTDVAAGLSVSGSGAAGG